MRAEIGDSQRDDRGETSLKRAGGDTRGQRLPALRAEPRGMGARDNRTTAGGPHEVSRAGAGRWSGRKTATTRSEEDPTPGEPGGAGPVGEEPEVIRCFRMFFAVSLALSSRSHRSQPAHPH